MCQNCNVSIWERPLISWSIRRRFPRSATDRVLLLCGLCLQGFKYSQDYCTICFKLYHNNSSSSSSAQQISSSPSDMPPALYSTAHAASVVTDIAGAGTVNQETSFSAWTVDEKSMVRLLRYFSPSSPAEIMNTCFRFSAMNASDGSTPSVKESTRCSTSPSLRDRIPSG